jgi:hypothetical protein
VVRRERAVFLVACGSAADHPGWWVPHQHTQQSRLGDKDAILRSKWPAVDTSEKIQMRGRIHALTEVDVLQSYDWYLGIRDNCTCYFPTTMRYAASTQDLIRLNERQCW